jgi:hypothetical protein
MGQRREDGEKEDGCRQVYIDSLSVVFPTQGVVLAAQCWPRACFLLGNPGVQEKRMGAFKLETAVTPTRHDPIIELDNRK